MGKITTQSSPDEMKAALLGVGAGVDDERMRRSRRMARQQGLDDSELKDLEEMVESRARIDDAATRERRLSEARNHEAYRSLGAFAQDVAGISMARGMEHAAPLAFARMRSYLEARGLKGQSRAMSEFSGSTGAFAVPTDFTRQVFDHARNQKDTPFARCRVFRSKSKEFHLPTFNETSQADGSRWGGLLARRQTSGATLIESDAGLGGVGFKLEPLFVYTIASSDLVADAPLLTDFLDEAVGLELAWVASDEILNGVNVDGCAGLLRPDGTTHPAVITVAKLSGGQTPQTLYAENVDQMVQSLWPPSRKNACWFVTHDAMQQIEEGIKSNTQITPGNAIWYLDDGQGGVWPYLRGMPIFLCEQSPAFSSLGDLALLDLTQYGLAIHVQGREGATGEFMQSEHFLWGTDQIAFRWKLRIAGAPLWSKPVTMKRTGKQTSPFVVMGPR
jgi:HK97 family phage major capsid protein